MPRKAKPPQKSTITVVVNGTPVSVTLHPPTGAGSCWYAYWAGAGYSRTTGQPSLEAATLAAEHMVRTWRSGAGDGKRPQLSDTVLSDEEFEAVQRAHFGRSNDAAAQARAAKSLADCVEAISAFREIVKMAPIEFTQPIAAATADICAAFQRKALTLPRNWRKKYPRSKPPEQVELIRANSVLEWSRALQAAFERANRNAGRKCVRGVVPAEKPLTTNPWTQFTGVEGEERPIRQFDDQELLSFLDYLATRWTAVDVAGLLAKVFLWSQARRVEVASLTWSQAKLVGEERHFHIVGNWGVERWFRIPIGVYNDLLAAKRGNGYVFVAYNEQLRRFYRGSRNLWRGRMVAEEFRPGNLADWFHERLVEWSATLPKGHATAHIFRKTTLQYTRHGEDVNRQVAQDARVSESVMMKNYVKETDEERRAKSNRVFTRIVASLTRNVAARYGYISLAAESLEAKVRAATEVRDWDLVRRLSAELAAMQTSPARPAEPAGERTGLAPVGRPDPFL